MKCSVCGVEGHRSNSKKFHPDAENVSKSIPKPAVITPELPKALLKVMPKPVAKTVIKPELQPIDDLNAVSDDDLDNYELKPKKLSFKNCTIIASVEEAQKSADGWLGNNTSPMHSYIVDCILNKGMHKALRRFIHPCAIIYANKWLSDRCMHTVTNVYDKPYEGIVNINNKIIRNSVLCKIKDKWRHYITDMYVDNTELPPQIGFDQDVIVMVEIPLVTFSIIDAKIYIIPTSEFVETNATTSVADIKITKEMRERYNTPEMIDKVINDIYK